MSTREHLAFEREKQARTVAIQFMRDAGYDDCHPMMGRQDRDLLVYEFQFEARKGPHATRKTLVEHLVVRIRFTGPDHKTLRPSFVTGPAYDGTSTT
jgi:hypothetical protein